MRATLTFQVRIPVDEKGEPLNGPSHPTRVGWRFLRADGALVADKESGVKFKAYMSPTIGEVTRIEKYTHEITGGLADFLDMQTGIQNGHAGIIREIETKIWPPKKGDESSHTSRPAVTAAALVEQNAKINAAWKVHDSIAMQGWSTLQNTMDRSHFCAQWRALIIDPFPGWEDVGGREWPQYEVFLAVWRAWLAAREGYRQGKAKPSAS